jgi:hypothetical protein
MTYSGIKRSILRMSAIVAYYAVLLALLVIVIQYSPSVQVLMCDR